MRTKYKRKNTTYIAYLQTLLHNSANIYWSSLEFFRTFAEIYYTDEKVYIFDIDTTVHYGCRNCTEQWYRARDSQRGD